MKLKKIGIIAIILGILFLVGLYLYQKSYAYRVEVTVINKTQERIDHLQLSYTGCEEDIKVPCANSNKEITFRPELIFKQDIYHMDVWIYYYDNNHHMHKMKVLEDYAWEQKNRIKCTVIIESVDENGMMEVTCQ